MALKATAIDRQKELIAARRYAGRRDRTDERLRGTDSAGQATSRQHGREQTEASGLLPGTHLCLFVKSNSITGAEIRHPGPNSLPV